MFQLALAFNYGIFSVLMLRLRWSGHCVHVFVIDSDTGRCSLPLSRFCFVHVLVYSLMHSSTKPTNTTAIAPITIIANISTICVCELYSTVLVCVNHESTCHDSLQGRGVYFAVVVHMCLFGDGGVWFLVVVS